MKGAVTASVASSQIMVENEKQLRITGYWPGGSNPITILQFLHSALCVFLNFAFLEIPEIIFIRQNFDDMLEVSQCVSETLSIILSSLKMLLVLWYRPRLYELINDIKSKWEESKVEYNEPDWITVVEFTEKQSKYFTYGYVYTYVGLGMNFIMNPVIFMAGKAYLHNITITPAVLPTTIKLGYPFDIETSWFNYWAAHLSADLAVFMSITFMASYDAFNLAMINYVAAFFTLVNVKLDNLHKKYNNRVEMEQNLMKDMSDIVKQHSKAMEFVERLEEVSHLFMIIQYLSSTFLLCMVGFHLSIFLENLYEFFHVLTYCLCLNMQLFTFSWFGSKLMEESANIANSAYGCQWYDKPLKFQKCIVLIMARSQRPLGISAGKFYLISLESFSKVLSASLSYFTLLQTVYNE